LFPAQKRLGFRFCLTDGPAAVPALEELPDSWDEGELDAALRYDTAVGDVVTREWSPPADSLENAIRVSGKFGGVAGVFAGAIILKCPF